MLILVGPSASGKTEAVKILIKEYGLEKLVTYTTRKMRPGEINGVDYHFITKEEFKQRIDNDFFLEYVEYNGNFYGTSFTDLKSNKVVILEPSGVKTYKAKVPDLIKICYLHTSVEYRLKRMIQRGDQEEQIKLRIANDDNIFNAEIENMADWIVESDGVSMDDMTREIYNLYKPFI